jgi:hypothetical protein
MKELMLKMDATTIGLVEQEIRRKRSTGGAGSVGDRFLIRLVEAFNSENKVLSFKFEDGKLKVRTSTSL